MSVRASFAEAVRWVGTTDAAGQYPESHTMYDRSRYKLRIDANAINSHNGGDINTHVSHILGSTSWSHKRAARRISSHIATGLYRIYRRYCFSTPK